MPIKAIPPRTAASKKRRRNGAQYYRRKSIASRAKRGRKRHSVPKCVMLSSRVFMPAPAAKRRFSTMRKSLNPTAVGRHFRSLCRIMLLLITKTGVSAVTASRRFVMFVMRISDTFLKTGRRRPECGFVSTHLRCKRWTVVRRTVDGGDRLLFFVLCLVRKSFLRLHLFRNSPPAPARFPRKADRFATRRVVLPSAKFYP